MASYVFNKKFTIDSTGESYVFPSGRQIAVTNYGNGNILLGFNEATSADSFQLNAGLTITLNIDCRTLYMKALTATDATVGVLLVKHNQS